MAGVTPISPDNAYRSEEYTDEKAGGIIRLIPVTADGVQDPQRLELFIGKTFMQSPQGPIEVRFPIQTLDLAGAFDKWTETLKAKLVDLEEEGRRAQILNGAQLAPSQARALTQKPKR